MREGLLDHVVCPACGGRLGLAEGADRDAREIRAGDVACVACSASYPVRGGILDLLPAPSQTVASERRGWVHLLGEPKAEMAPDMFRLPYLEADIWQTTAANFDQALELVDLRGMSVLDVGGGRCWSARRMMEHGASYVLAVDILEEMYIGLETGDLFLKRGEPYFDRLLADMNALPIRPASFDVVFMSGTLHHSSDPEAAMQGVGRALTAGGVAVVVNEPVARWRQGEGPAQNVEREHGINENIYPIRRYLAATRGAGLIPRLYFPRSVDRHLERGEQETLRLELGQTGARVVTALARNRAARRSLDRGIPRWLYGIAGLPLVMVARAP